MSPCAARPRGRDRGFTFVELLVSIVLIGTAVLATLVGLRATIVASAVNDERAHLVAWLQEGVEAIHRTPYEPCTSGTVKADYQAALDLVPDPAGWSGGALILDDPLYASVDPSKYVERWSTSCVAYPERTSQLLTITATSPDGSLSETVKVVRDG